MKAGRELDALVAEKVMGWVENTDPQGCCYIEPHTGVEHHSFAPSTDIAAAWEVLDAIGGNEFDAEITCGMDGVSVGINRTISGDHEHCATGDTAPHAICLAALEAVRKERQ